MRKELGWRVDGRGRAWHASFCLRKEWELARVGCGAINGPYTVLAHVEGVFVEGLRCFPSLSECEFKESCLLNSASMTLYQVAFSAWR